MLLSSRSQVTFGLGINFASWWIAWNGPEPARYHTFFPLWFGYIVAIDGVTRAVAGSSLISRLRARFIWLFVVSIPLWWLFELANKRLENWSYVKPHEYGWLEYHLEASIAFSTVAPAIFVTVELVRSVLIRGTIRWLQLRPSQAQLAVISAAGFSGFAATMVFPNVLFPLVWLSLFLALDPLLYLAGGRSLSSHARSGRWDPVLALFVASLICGFLWEFWNSRSMPKWEYEIGYADWLRLFEMPALGYGGYLPFALEVYTIVAMVDRAFRLKLAQAFRFDVPSRSR